MKPGRVACCIPFCRRTVAAERLSPNNEWICGNHWPQVPKKLRAFKIKADRFHERVSEAFYATFQEADQHAKSHNGHVSEDVAKRLHEASDRREKSRQRLGRVWGRCKRRAIEAAMGI